MGCKVNWAKTEHLQTTGDTNHVKMKRWISYRYSQLANSPIVHISRIKDTQKRRSQKRRGEQSSKGTVETERICDKKVQAKMKLLIYHTVIRLTLKYGCDTWPMSVKDEMRMATT